jgi:hypothetical protein
MIKKYTTTQLRDILEDAIRNERRHKHYNRTVELAKLYKQLMTGKDQKELVMSYKSRETDEQKEQRFAITHSRTQYVNNKILTVFKRVPRSDTVIDNIYYEDDDKKNNDRVAEVQERFKNFHKGQTLSDYLTEAFEHFVFYDPNAWLVIEMRKMKDKKPFVYPVEVTSEQAIKYEWSDGDLQYLIIKHASNVWEKGKTTEPPIPASDGSIRLAVDMYHGAKDRPGDKFLLYAADVAFQYLEIASPDKRPVDYEPAPGAELVEISVKGAKKYFEASAYDTKSKICPMMQFGYITDPETDRETFVSPAHPSVIIQKDLINTKSEFDLTKALHGFMKMIQYAQVCENEEQFEENTDRCIQGKMNLSGENCKECGGLGMKVHTSSQDIILVKWPDGKEEYIPLSEAVHYVTVPEHMVAMWKNEVADLERDCSLAIFNTNLFDRSEIAVTATEKRINTEAAYDVLFDYGSQFSAMFKFVAMMAAIHTQNDEGIVIEHKIASFNLDTTIDLIANRKAAVDAGSPYVVVQAFDMKLLSKMSQDDPINVEWMKVREKLRPFREKSKEEKMFILAELPPDDPKKVLYIHFEDIMDQIEEEHTDPPFYKLEPKAQRKLVAAKVTPLIPKPVAIVPFGRDVPKPGEKDEDDEGQPGATKPIQPLKPTPPNAG